jgi:hypothetical protein
MFLVCKQVWSEYIPILLASTPIAFSIKQLDFRPLLRLISILRRAELMALRQNTRLTIRLVLLKGKDPDLTHLRRWLERRADDNTNHLDWKYMVAKAHPKPMSTYEALQVQYTSLHEGLQHELEPILNALWVAVNAKLAM